MSDGSAPGGRLPHRRRAGLDHDHANNIQRELVNKQAAEIDELLVRLGIALRRGALDSWEAGFAKSILGRAKRAGPRWQPSARQLSAMRRICDAAALPELVEDDG